MTGLVLAAGLGKRLAPLTEERPKGLIELGGRSLLARLLDGLQAAGVHQTVLVVGYRQEMIRASGIERKARIAYYGIRCHMSSTSPSMHTCSIP